MGVTTEFEMLEQQFLELIGEFRTLTVSNLPVLNRVPFYKHLLL